ncbi:response regulator [Psychrobacter sp. DAB_AL32B]|uniref:response regulator n=1 Tax=Psychrobacter sp. DAB_AL32B TaxID=1028414 RepID=UPI000B7C745A|nr:response regulator [Psychrobacter sp. DAB_AL32B]OXL21835.1 histidine kinase [Psychrobacter sp. DAB_AL32B]
MQQFQSLQRLLIFYTLTLLAMLLLYYFTMFYEMRNDSEQRSVEAFHSLQYEITEHANPIDAEIKEILKKPFFKDISYQLIFMLPSGQTYIHRYTQPNEDEFTGIMFPNIVTSLQSDSRIHSAYTLTNHSLVGSIKLDSGHKIYTILRHKPLDINWISYRYWLPLMTAIMFFILALLYTLKRRANWEKLLLYTDNLSSHAKDGYTPPPFIEKGTTPEFLQLGHSLSRINYQLHSNHRRITTLKHRLERLVDHAPLPMLMIMRHGQISFFNQRFEQVFATLFQSDSNYHLTDFVFSEDTSTQLLLQKLANLRVTRTLMVYGLVNKKAYQLHITPWFGEHGQVHGFTVLLNNINELVNQTADLQQKNLQMQRQLDEFNTLKSTMGRDLRLPLEAMIDTLEPIDPTTLTADQNQTLDTLIQASHSMLIMLNDMLDIGEIEIRKSRLNIEPVDIYRIGQQVSHLLVDSTRQQGLELLYFFAPDCPRCINTDPKRLQQILRNLLDNAIKHTPAGYVALTIEAVNGAQLSNTKDGDDGLIPVNESNKTNPSHDWVRFSIQDSGIGLETSKQSQLNTYFNQTLKSEDNRANNRANNQAYLQTESKTSLQILQKGIGLRTAHSFSKLLGGFIEVQSTPNLGSTFSLYLPCRHPNYQPIYHLNPHLKHIHLIAIINQPLASEHLQRLCKHLSIPATISTAVNRASLQQLTDQLAQNEQTLAPILLLDYEYYESLTIALSNQIKTDNKNINDKQLIHLKTEVEDLEANALEGQLNLENQASRNIDRQYILNHLLAKPSLPKILLSMKLERRIPSMLLDKCDGFLTKPLDATLLLSELLRLTLPIRQALIPQASIKDDNSPLAADNAASETLSSLILVVEDSPTNQKIACKILAKLGYRSIVAEDGQQALNALQAQRQEIALILMDCRMPVMDGLQATHAIRAQGDDIPIVALTANNTEEDRAACLEVGMDEFLSKPINKNKLQEVLEILIKN